MKKNKLFMMGTLAMMLAFGLVLAGCGDDSGSGGGGSSRAGSELLGKWVKSEYVYWEFEDEGDRMGITASLSGMGVVGVKSYDGANLTFNDDKTCTATILDNVLTISGYESGKGDDYDDILNGEFTKQPGDLFYAASPSLRASTKQ